MHASFYLLDPHSIPFFTWRDSRASSPRCISLRPVAGAGGNSKPPSFTPCGRRSEGGKTIGAERFCSGDQGPVNSCTLSSQPVVIFSAHTLELLDVLLVLQKRTGCLSPCLLVLPIYPLSEGEGLRNGGKLRREGGRRGGEEGERMTVRRDYGQKSTAVFATGTDASSQARSRILVTPLRLHTALQ